MESLERLFGKELTNVEEAMLVKLSLKRGKTGLRSLSFCGEAPKQLAQGRENINPNVSQKMHKPRFAESDPPQEDLRESLTDYFDESISFMLAQESSSSQPVGCLSRQSEVTESMRAILMDWIVDIHLKFKMFPQTLFIVAAIIDRYLAAKLVRKE